MKTPKKMVRQCSKQKSRLRVFKNKYRHESLDKQLLEAPNRMEKYYHLDVLW